jgi:phosphate transport system permease protein
MAAAARRIARLKRIDRIAVGVITLGGVAIIIAVLGILVFIGAEALPLFQPARVTPLGAVPAGPSLTALHSKSFEVLGTDEYLKYFYGVEPNGRVVFRQLATGEVAREIPVPGLAAATVTASSRSLLENFVAAGLSDGRLSLMQLRFTPVFTEKRVTDVSL